MVSMQPALSITNRLKKTKIISLCRCLGTNCNVIYSNDSLIAHLKFQRLLTSNLLHTDPNNCKVRAAACAIQDKFVINEISKLKKDSKYVENVYIIINNFIKCMFILPRSNFKVEENFPEDLYKRLMYTNDHSMSFVLSLEDIYNFGTYQNNLISEKMTLLQQLQPEDIQNIITNFLNNTIQNNTIPTSPSKSTSSANSSISSKRKKSDQSEYSNNTYNILNGSNATTNLVTRNSYIVQDRMKKGLDTYESYEERIFMYYNIPLFSSTVDYLYNILKDTITQLNNEIPLDNVDYNTLQDLRSNNINNINDLQKVYNLIVNKYQINLWLYSWNAELKHPYIMFHPKHMSLNDIQYDNPDYIFILHNGNFQHNDKSFYRLLYCNIY
jgi:hypothetical protein